MIIKEIKYSMKVRLPLRLGSGIQIGNLLTFNRELIYEKNNEKFLLIPGNTLRGLIASSLMKILCSKISEHKFSELCTVTGTCDKRCPIIHLTSSTTKKIVIFHFGKARLNNYHIIVRKVHTTLDRSNKTSTLGVSPYVIEVLDSLNPHNRFIEVSSKIIVLGGNEDLVDVLRKGIMSINGNCLGGKRTWGYGIVKETKIENIREVNIDKEKDSIKAVGNTLYLTLETPLPLDFSKGRDPNEIIENLCKELIEFYFNEIVSIKAELKGAYRLIPIFWWNEAINRPYRSLAISQGAIIQIKANNETLRKIALIAQYFGVTDPKKWYSRCGYGVGKPHSLSICQ